MSYDPTAFDPYAAPTFGPPFRAGYGDALALPLASREARLGAFLIDGAVFIVPIVVGSIGFGVYVYGTRFGEAGVDNSLTIATAFIGVMVFVLAIAIVQLRLLYGSGQSIGKRLLGIRIVSTDGSRATSGQLSKRTFIPVVISFVPLAGHLFFLLDSLMIFGNERRCLHDQIADTKVTVAR